MPEEQLQFLPVSYAGAAEPLKIAVRSRSTGSGGAGGVLWLGGFNSDMLGTKAVAVAEWASKAGLDCTRFDYSGHGESDGALSEGTISRWFGEATAVFERFTRGGQILIGSSMGGWIALLLARAQAKAAGKASRIRGLVLIAPAADMTKRLMWDEFPEDIRAQITREGIYLQPSEYGEPYPITRTLIEDGRQHCLLEESMSAGCPVRILHGMRDPDVPWQLSLDIIAALKEDDVTLTLIKDGDHRLSRDEDIGRLLATLDSFI